MSDSSKSKNQDVDDKSLLISNPTTHIIIVNYNAGEWLERSVRSALTHSNGQITVVDNNSTDDSVANARANFSDQRLEWVLNTENLGFAAANNQIMQTSDADFYVLMNPDCELGEQTLSAILSVFRQHAEIGLTSCRILNSDGSLQATCRRRFPTPWSALVRMLQLHRLFPGSPKFASFDYGDQIDTTLGVEIVDAISGAFMVARKTAVIDVGLLDEQYFMHCEDLDWCMRFAQSGWKVGFVPDVSVIHAKGVSSQSRPIGVLLTLHKGMDRFFDKFYQQESSVALRLVVKLGIAVSFLSRAALTLLKGLVR